MAQTDAAKLTTEQRGNLPKSSFAYVDKDGKGHLPIQDAEHVKNALARLNQTDISDSAKRKALRKIRRAAKRYGVEVDPDSDVVKRYGAHENSLEAQLQKVREAFLDEFGEREGNDWQYVQYTYDTYLIFQRGDKTFRVDYTQDGDDFEFGEPSEVEVVFKPKSEGAKPMSDKTYTQAEVDAVVEAKLAEAKTAQAKTREVDAAVERVEAKRREIAAAAIEDFKSQEKLVGDRMKELDGIFAVVVSEREDLEAKVRAADENAYTQIKAERAMFALDAARKDAVAAAINEDTVPALSLRGGRPAGGKTFADPFAVTVSKP